MTQTPSPLPSPAPARNSRNPVPWIIAAVVVIVAAVAALVFWMVSNRAGETDGTEMDQALGGLRSSISTAEQSLERARTSADALAEGAKGSSDPAVEQLAADADVAVVEFTQTLNGAKEVLQSAETQKPSSKVVTEVQETTASLDGLTEELDEVTGSVEEATEELQATPRAMDLAQIAKGDYSSIAGTWTSANVTPGDSNYQSLEVKGATIDWTAFDAPFGRVEGLEYHPVRPVDAGSVFSSEVIVNTSSAVAIQWMTHLEQFGTDMGNMLVFYPAGVQAIVPITGDVVPSDESVERIMALPTNGGGRLYVTDGSPFLLTKSGDQTSESTAKPADCVAPVEGAYACAGGPIPADAKQLPVQIDPVNGTPFVGAQTPSGNINCDALDANVAADARVVCSVRGWTTEMVPNYDPNTGGYPAAGLHSTGPASMGTKGDPMMNMNSGSFIGETLPYGTVWYYGDFVFASQESGLTFWNAKSRYGALINRDGFYPFGPN